MQPQKYSYHRTNTRLHSPTMSHTRNIQKYGGRWQQLDTKQIEAEERTAENLVQTPMELDYAEHRKKIMAQFYKDNAPVNKQLDDLDHLFEGTLKNKALEGGWEKPATIKKEPKTEFVKKVLQSYEGEAKFEEAKPAKQKAREKAAREQKWKEEDEAREREEAEEAERFWDIDLSDDPLSSI